MKNKIFKDLVSYCDISSEEELKLRLIGCLLSKCSEELSENEVREVGWLIIQHLQKKMIIDHYFFGRTISGEYFPKDQKREALTLLKSSLKRMKE